MTSRERLIAVSRGEPTDRKPVVCWPVSCPESDVTTDAVALNQIRLSPVVNPFGQAIRRRVDVWDTLAEDPARGAKQLDSLVDRTRREAQGALEHGADGILYLLYGARGLHSTPMEYGGHYLERDREILGEFGSATFNMVFVVGEDDAYLDFVSDLPAHAFGWDASATGVGVAELRPMRPGALATNAPDADIELRFGVGGVCAHLESNLQESHG